MDIKNIGQINNVNEQHKTSDSEKPKDTAFQKEMGRDALGNGALGESLVRRPQKDKTKLLQTINTILEQKAMKPITSIAPGMLKTLLTECNSSDEFYAKINFIADMLESNYSYENINMLASEINEKNDKNIRKILEDKDIDISRLSELAEKINDDNIEAIKDLVKDSSLNINRLTFAYITGENADIVKLLANNEDCSVQNYFYITQFTNKDNIDLAKRIVNHEKVSFDLASQILDANRMNPENLEIQKQFINELLDNKDFDITKFNDEMGAYKFFNILKNLNNDNYETTKKLCFSNIDLHNLDDFLKSITPENQEIAIKLLSECPDKYKGNLVLSEQAEQYLELIAPYKDDENYESLFRLFEEEINIIDMSTVNDILNSDSDTKTKANIIQLFNRGVDPDKAAQTVQNYPQSKKINIGTQVILSEFINKSDDVKKIIPQLIENIPDTRELEHSLAVTYDILDKELATHEYNKETGFCDYKLSSEDEKLEFINNIIVTNKLKNIPPKLLEENIYLNWTGLKMLSSLPQIKPEQYSTLIEPFYGAFIRGAYQAIGYKEDVLKSLAVQLNDDDDTNSPKFKYLINILGKTTSITTPEELEQYKKIDLNNYPEEFREEETTKETITEINRTTEKDTIGSYGEIDNEIWDKIFETANEYQKSHQCQGLKLDNKQYNGDDQHIYIAENNSTNILKFDKNTGDLLAIQEDNTVKNITHNTIAETTYMREAVNTTEVGDSPSYDVPYALSITMKDKDGNVIKTDTYLESEITGEYTIWNTDVSEDTSLIGLAEKDENGGNHIEKHLTSLDGTVTDYVYADDTKGNRFLYQKITDKDGNVLMELKKTHKQISENHSQTTINGQTYDVQFLDDKVVVTKLDKDNNTVSQRVEYQIREFSTEEKEKIKASFNAKPEITEVDNITKLKEFTALLIKEHNLEYVIDKTTLPLLKTLSADEWMNMATSETKSVLNLNLMNENAFSAAGLIELSDSQLSKLSTFMHELGHEKFGHLNLDKDNELRKIYEEEKRLFTTTFPNENIKSIDYFLSNNDQNSRGLNETVAETNLLLNTYGMWNITQDRTILLQQYFPKTIAYLATKLLDVK